MAVILNRVILLSSSMADTTKVLLYVPQLRLAREQNKHTSVAGVSLYVLMAEEVEVAMSTKQVRIRIDS